MILFLLLYILIAGYVCSWIGGFVVWIGTTLLGITSSFILVILFWIGFIFGAFICRRVLYDATSY